MDQKEVYIQMSNAFLLGNYFKVFDLLKTYPLDNPEGTSRYKDEISVLIVRSFVALEDRRTPELKAMIDANSDIKKFLEIGEYYLNVLLNGNEEEVKNASEIMIKMHIPYHLSGYLAGYFSLKTMNYKMIDTTTSIHLEKFLPALILLLKMNQISLAEIIKKKMSSSNDEDLATHLAHIFILIFSGKFEDAVFLIDETKEKFQDSLKLLNLKSACLIALKQYDNAKIMLEKLLNILTNKEQYKDKQETEICLYNLVVLHVIQGLPYDEYLKQLQPNHPFLTKYHNAEKLFDSLAQSMK